VGSARMAWFACGFRAKPVRMGTELRAFGAPICPRGGWFGSPATSGPDLRARRGWLGLPAASGLSLCGWGQSYAPLALRSVPGVGGLVCLRFQGHACASGDRATRRWRFDLSPGGWFGSPAVTGPRLRVRRQASWQARERVGPRGYCVGALKRRQPSHPNSRSVCILRS